MDKIISRDGSATLFSEHYGQTYHSVHGAVTESELVYLQYSGIRDRLEQGLDSRVLEIGFGLGLNFLLTARTALQSAATLNYLALENAPVSQSEFNSLNYNSIDGLSALADTTADVFDTLSKATDADLTYNGRIRLKVLLANAVTARLDDSCFDAIYLDAFSPEANPELWSVSFLKQLFHALKPGGCVSTYCVKSSVRRAFFDAGFQVRKLPGPPGKREVLVAARAENVRLPARE